MTLMEMTSRVCFVALVFFLVVMMMSFSLQGVGVNAFSPMMTASRSSSSSSSSRGTRGIVQNFLPAHSSSSCYHRWNDFSSSRLHSTMEDDTNEEEVQQNNNPNDEEYDQSNNNNNVMDDAKDQDKIETIQEGLVMLHDLNWRVEKLRLEEANTRRFLKSGPRFLPYEECRKWVIAFNRWHSEEEWRQWIMDGEKRNPYIPSYPDEYYGNRGEWKGWGHFLGVEGEDGDGSKSDDGTIVEGGLDDVQ